ncbi:ABC transporter substrate-binding protein [Oribacterium sp. WCC10]|uniref:ABC transporter substrate-binding protein n=1 Tax=Oribacterium sp. WCC10 TaxID=1855343 RepID=UPI0008F3A7F4|nr:ABC transporter substrate-binding protein [Oribacterium sp. WCC10]SFG30569.1 monosaccharide ABC transporter substrate-binding protein, CUT2 family [Oribacterium sp. WCC10]
MIYNGYKITHKVVFSLLLLLFAVSVSSCSPFNVDETSQNVRPAETEPAENLIRVGFSQLGSESKWRRANSISIRDALTVDDGFFLQFNNARQKQENQIKAIRGFISQQVDYIAFCPVTEDGWDTVLKEAKDANIPVILVDRQVSADSSLYTTWIGENMRKEGENAGLWLEKILEERGKNHDKINIIELIGTRGSSSQLGRSMGFDTVCEKHKNWVMLDREDGEFTTAKGQEVMSGFLQKYDDIDVVVCQNDDMAIGALQAMKDAGMDLYGDEKPIIVSFDASRQGLEMVMQGIIDVDVECKPSSGEKLAEVIHELERGNQVAKEYYMDEEVFTIDNALKYVDERSY